MMKVASKYYAAVGASAPLLRPIVSGTRASGRRRKDLARRFHTRRSLRTDGVYPELTAMRVRVPWIEAFRERQDAEAASGRRAEPTGTTHRDLAPKKMSASHHSIVSRTSLDSQEFWALIVLRDSRSCRWPGMRGCRTTILTLPATSGLPFDEPSGVYTMTGRAG